MARDRFRRFDITDIPSRTVTIAITAHDPDIPRDRRPDGNFDHWVVWNLPRDTTHVASATEHGGTVGTTTIVARTIESPLSAARRRTTSLLPQNACARFRT